MIALRTLLFAITAGLLGAPATAFTTRGPDMLDARRVPRRARREVWGDGSRAAPKKNERLHGPSPRDERDAPFRLSFPRLFAGNSNPIATALRRGEASFWPIAVFPLLPVKRNAV